MGERRNTLRQKSFLRGCVYFNRRRTAVDCLIRDISDEGARIIFSGAVSVPDVLDLYIPQKEETVRARVQWRRADEIGLSFTDAARAPPPPDDLEHRVSQLEREVAALRRLLKRVKGGTEKGGDADAA
jgi:hypothetical protein